MYYEGRQLNLRLYEAGACAYLRRIQQTFDELAVFRGIEARHAAVDDPPQTRDVQAAPGPPHLLQLARAHVYNTL